MLDDTLRTLSNSHCFREILVVTGDDRAGEIARKRGAEVVFQEKDTGVNSAVALADTYSVNAGADATVVVPQDLPLMTAEDMKCVCSLAEGESCIALCPSLRLDGTNILLRKPPYAIATNYDNHSYESHLEVAKASGMRTDPSGCW